MKALFPEFIKLFGISFILAFFLAGCALLGEEPAAGNSEDLRRQLRENERVQLEQKRRIDELNNRYDMLEARFKELQAQMKSFVAKHPLEEGLREEAIAPAAAPRTPASAVKEAPAPRPAEKPEKLDLRISSTTETRMVYDEAYRNYASGQYQRARLLFQDFVQKYPQDPLAANALYWIGECYYDLKNFNDAIAAWQKTADTYPKSPKAADALYKKALCYQELKYEDWAVQTFQEVIADYPKSDAAKLAKERLAKMKKP